MNILAFILVIFATPFANYFTISQNTATCFFKERT